MKKIAARILVLLLIMAGLNFIYTNTLFKKELKEKCPEVLTIREEQKQSDVLYFTESSNFSEGESEAVKTPISEYANSFFPSLKITYIKKLAAHAGIFKQLIRQVDPKAGKVKAIVVTMNLRSFDAGWIHSRLETPLRESMVLIQPYPNIVNRFLLSLQSFDNKTEEQRNNDLHNDWRHTKLIFPFPFKYKTVTEWDTLVGLGGYLKPDGSWDMDRITLACHYIKAYAFNITEQNPRIKDFDDIVDWCDKNKLPLYFNLMAENIQYADSLAGKELVFLMRQNRDFLVKRYNKNNCTVVDNLELVPGIEFTDQKWTTEHYNYKGRMIVGKNLAEQLRKQFNNDYKTAY